jgi:hypothetical protein
MLSWNQIQQELKAIEEFDNLMLAEPSHTQEEFYGYVARCARKQELAQLLKALVATRVARKD